MSNEQKSKVKTKTNEHSKFENLLYFLDIKKEKHTHNHDHSHGCEESHADVKMWKLLIGAMVLPFALVHLAEQFGAALPHLPGVMRSPWWMFGWATFIFILIGIDYIRPAIRDIREKNISVTIFVVVSTITAYVYSCVMLGTNFTGVESGSTKVFFDSVIEILVIIYFGNWLEDKFTRTTEKNLDDIVNLYAKEAILIKGKKEIKVKPDKLQVGDIVLVKNGEKIPSDGVVVHGEAVINQATFTGESLPVNAFLGVEVLGGTIPQGTIQVKITKTLDKSLLSQVVNGIQKTRDQKTKTTKIARKFSKWLLPIIFVAAFSALIGWTITNDLEKGIEVFITSLVVTCPMSLILLTPTATLVSSSVAAKKGIVYNANDLFERVKDIDVICFDKTGTLTEGKLSVSSNTIDNKYNDIVKTMEKESSHPIAKSVVDFYKRANVIKGLKVREVSGRGLEAKHKNETYHIGSYQYAKTTHHQYNETPEMIEQRQDGSIFIYLFTKKEIIGYIELRDKIKPTAKDAVARFEKKGVEVYMITGDNQYTAQYVAEKVGIKMKNVYGDTMPDAKARIIRGLQDDGKYIAFTGDGINDAIALEQANVGISIGHGSSIAIDSSDITIQNNDLNLIYESLHISRQTLKTIYIGISVAITYNIIILSLATTGVLLPFFGAISMVINDTMPIVISSTLYRLKWTKK